MRHAHLDATEDGTYPEPEHTLSLGHTLSRRGFLGACGSCAAHLLWMSSAASVGLRRAYATESAGKVVAKQPWGRLEELHDGVWALISTPLAENDWTTLSNGGIIAGKDRVLVVESFARTEGAAWVAQRTHELTGRWPTDVVLTHYHGDHTNGVAGFSKGQQTPRIWATPTTRALLGPKEGESNNSGRADQSAREGLFASLAELDESDSTEIDLGGRKVRLHPRTGHTASDVTIELEDPSVVFYGDLLWSGMFPNYRDTTPSAFASSIRAAMRERETVYVPGHGPLAGAADVKRLLAVLGEIEAAARKCYGTDMTASEAGRLFQIPESLGRWTLFNDQYFATAISAWHKELGSHR